MTTAGPSDPDPDRPRIPTQAELDAEDMAEIARLSKDKDRQNRYPSRRADPGPPPAPLVRDARVLWWIAATACLAWVMYGLINLGWLEDLMAERLLPAEIAQRRKQPYRAPIHRAFLADPPAYVDELLSADAIRAVGVCDPQAIERLRLKAASGRKMSEPEDMALAGILSTQLLHRLFVADFPHSVPEVGPVRICRGKDDCS